MAHFCQGLFWYIFALLLKHADLTSITGTLKRQSVLLNTNRNERERAGKLQLLYGSEAQDVEELPFGSVGVIVGLRFTRTGDTLISTGAKVSNDSDTLPTIVYSSLCHLRLSSASVAF